MLVEESQDKFKKDVRRQTMRNDYSEPEGTGGQFFCQKSDNQIVKIDNQIIKSVSSDS